VLTILCSRYGWDLLALSISDPSLAPPLLVIYPSIAPDLVANAIKFTDVGTIAIWMAADGGGFLVSVSDAGPGVPEDQRERIFEDLQQVDSPASRNKGTGLGVAIAKRIAKLHGGRSWVEPVIGKDPTFFLSLPIKAERKEVAT